MTSTSPRRKRPSPFRVLDGQRKVPARVEASQAANFPVDCRRCIAAKWTLVRIRRWLSLPKRQRQRSRASWVGSGTFARSAGRGRLAEMADRRPLDQTAAIVCTSTRKASLTSRSIMRRVFGGYLPSGNIFGNSRNRNCMNFGMSCEWTRYVVN